MGVDPDPANADRISRWAQDYWTELHPHSAGGAYVNFLMEEGHDRVKAAYRGNYERLSQIKGRYDPANTFHVNQNIKPATSNPVEPQRCTDRGFGPLKGALNHDQCSVPGV